MEAANPGMVDIPVRAAAIQRALVQISRDLEAFRSTGIGQANRARFDAAIHDVNEYYSATQVVTSMLDVNFASAASQLDSFHRPAHRVTGPVKIGREP